jgi:uncharacterized protein (DUF1330 family)
MKTYQAVTLALIVGFGLGAGAIESLRAAAKPPAYYIAMNTVTDANGYLSDFAKDSAAYARSQGAQFIVQGGSVKTLAGKAPTARVVIQQWASMDKLMAWWNSPKNQDLQKLGAKYAHFHSFAVEGLPQ